MNPLPVPGAAGAGLLRDASYIQRFLWEERRAGRGAAGAARALRLCGHIDPGRLTAAVGEVAAAMEILRVGFAADDPVMSPPRPGPALYQASAPGPPAERDRRCAEILCRDRDRMPDSARDPLVRFHLIRCGPAETVPGVVADPLLLDLRSLYLVLGAIMQAYFGRFRDTQYPPFDQFASADPVGRAEVRESRLGWWSRRLAQWHQAAGQDQPWPAGPPGATGIHARELCLSEDRWSRLSRAGGGQGNAGSLAVIALLAWWFRTRSPRRRPPVFGSTLDLRDYGDLGPVVGPLTDRIVFAVDIDGFARMTFTDLVFRAHAGLLDAVVHYLPYQEVVALGVADGILQPPCVARHWDVAIHYCRTPPASAYTRGEETLARRGLSIELFHESVLDSAGAGSRGTGDGMAMEIHLAESGTGMALVVNFDPLVAPGDEVAAMLNDLDHVVDAVIADPQIALSSI